MVKIHEKYVVDSRGHKQAVIVDYNEWNAIVDALEELDDIQFYDKEKKKKDRILPFDDAVKEIRQGVK